MNIGQVVLFIVVVAVVATQVCFIVWFWLIMDRKFKEESFFEFEKCLVKLDQSKKITVFINNHPYVWVETTIDDARRSIMSAIPCAQGFSYAKSLYLTKIDINKNAIYLVICANKNSTWPNLMHYEEWIESNKVYADRIELYKKSRSIA